MSDQLQNIVRQIVKLLADRKVPRCADLTAEGAHGYYLVPRPEYGRVTVGYVESRHGVPSYSEQMNFLRTFGPVLAATFGEQRVSRVTIKLRVVGRLRPVPGLRVDVSSSS